MARLTPITEKDQLAPQDRAIGEAIGRSRGAIQGPFTMLLHSPQLAGRVAHLGAFVRFEGALDMKVRVLAAMTVARELDALYVWGAQTGGARRLGVAESAIAAIREKGSKGLSPEEELVVQATRELLRRHRISKAHWEKLLSRFGEEGVMELLGVIGYYSMLATVVNGCELEASEGAEKLPV